MFRPLPVGFSTIAYAFSALPRRTLSPVFLRSGPDDPRTGPVREDRVPPLAQEPGQGRSPLPVRGRRKGVRRPQLPVHAPPFRTSAET